MAKKQGKSEKRGKGEGSIYQLADGTYRGFVTLGYDAETGKQRRKYIRGKTRREVADRLNKVMALSGNRILSAPERVTVEEWLNRFAKHRALEVRTGTKRNHQHYLSKILPVLGGLQLHKLTAHHIREFYAKLVEANLSPSVRQHIHHFLSSALADAERLFEDFRSPMGAVDRPKGGRCIEPQVWEPREVRAFLDLVAGHRLYPAFYLMLTQGLRIGEVLALQWSDLQGEVLQVRHTVYLDEDGRPALGPPKTERGRRKLYLREDALGVLADHRVRQRQEREVAKRWNPNEFIFCSEVGTLMFPNNVRRMYKGTLRKLFFDAFIRNVILFKAGYLHLVQPEAGLRYIRIHDQRHTYTTAAREKGNIPLEELADRLGQDPRVTLATYSHITETRRRRAAKSVAELY